MTGVVPDTPSLAVLLPSAFPVLDPAPVVVGTYTEVEVRCGPGPGDRVGSTETTEDVVSGDTPEEVTSGAIGDVSFGSYGVDSRALPFVEVVPDGS